MWVIYPQKTSSFTSLSNSTLFLKNNGLIRYHTTIQIQMKVCPSSLGSLSNITSFQSHKIQTSHPKAIWAFPTDKWKSLTSEESSTHLSIHSYRQTSLSLEVIVCERDIERSGKLVYTRHYWCLHLSCMYCPMSFLDLVTQSSIHDHIHL